MSLRHLPFSVVLVVVFLNSAALGSAVPQARFDRERAYQEFLEEVLEDELLLCGAVPDDLPTSREVRAVPEGTPVFFRQDPPVFNYDYRGDVTLSDVTVVGNVPAITFDPSIADTNQDHPDEKWRRVGTDTIDGVKVSLFERTFTAEEMDLFFNSRRTGFDRPDLFIGALEPDIRERDGSRVITRFNIRLRVAPTSMKKVSVKKLSSQVSYSSDVVNIVLPGYGNDRVTDDGFSIQDRELAQVFYDNFKDTTQILAIVPRRPHLSSEFGAFHRATNQTVQGIGASQRDRNDQYGDPKALLAVEFFPNRALERNETWTHELAHQWGHFFDWETIAGLVRAGHQPAGHLPLATGGPTLVGAVLEADREVVGSARFGGRGAFSIGFPQPPYIFHPWVLYAMGLLPANKVPPLPVFTYQGQFDPDTSISPDVGTTVTGGTSTISIDDIIAVQGKRKGPKIPRKLKRTVIVVSREEQLTQAEFDYWTWIAQRHTYAKRDDGITSFDGYASFFQASGGKAKLVDVVDAKGGPKAKGKLKIAYSNFEPDDWRAVRFDKRLPTKIKPGKKINFSGQVVAADRDDFSRVLVRIRKHDPAGNARFGASVGNADGPAAQRRAEDIELRADLDANNRFGIEYTFSRAEAGRYSVEAFVFWPDSGSQFARDNRSPFHVE